MSELQNPLFDEEKEFLERKKLEYERALRGDVEHIKGQSVKVGKVAAVGVGLVGGIWLIAKALGGKKRKKRRFVADDDENYAAADSRDADYDDETEAEYFTAGNGKRYRSTVSRKTAADSARIFMEQEAHQYEADDAGFGSRAAQPVQPSQKSAETAFAAASSGAARGFSAAGSEDFEDDPFRDLPYDDSRRLPASHAFDEHDKAPAVQGANSRSKMIGTVLQAFLQSDTGKMLVAQAAAVALALVTKKMSEIFPPAKNADLAASSGNAPAQSGYVPDAPLASPDFPDAQPRPQPI